MEKRFILFIVLTMLLMTGHVLLRAWLVPPPPFVENVEQPAADQDLAAQPIDQPAAEPNATQDADEARTDSDTPLELSAQPELPGDLNAAPQRWVTLGDYNGTPLLVTLNSRGATVERIELTERKKKKSAELKYLNLDDQSGYLGHLALTLADRGGCQVNVVGTGTPAATAGVQFGDVITEVDDQVVGGPEQLEALLRDTKPSDSLRLSVRRTVDGVESTVNLTATLGVRPFQIIQPEPLEPNEFEEHPLSYLLSLTRVGSQQAEQGQAEIAGLPSLRDSIWEVNQIGEPATAVEFRFLIGEVPGMSGSLEVIKRFRLGTPADIDADSELAPYHLGFELEVVNHSDQAQQITYRLDGPNGLPLEGWWYSHKIHPDMFGAAGARDVIVNPQAGGQELYGASAIYKAATKNPVPTTALMAESDEALKRSLGYVGVDTQYFLAAMLPLTSGETPVDHYEFRRAEAMALGDLAAKGKGKIRTANVSFQLDSLPIDIPPGQSVSRQFLLFSGPKKPQLLESYGLGEAIYYGWFGVVSRPLSSILHFFYRVVGNYGLAIIMLTVLVRSCMFPISRKAAKNAAMMQELAPEMKKITEKYKNEMDKRAKAQQDLFRKHNYNPLSGCWLMFLQLPIFLGLYRCLSVDIELRQAPLIPGIAWCSNLAGPDKLLHWENDFLGLFTEIGMLGPYFNVLPIITIGMFLVHQKLFMPPATDEQTKMQLKMMKFMMIFMGVMFFKVAAGLCLYFIASSLWGIAERKLLPKPAKKAADQAVSPAKPAPRAKPPTGGGSNGSSASCAKPKRNKRR